MNKDVEELVNRHQVVSTAEVEMLVHRSTLKRMADRGKVVRLRNGYYSRAERLEDGRIVDGSDDMAKMAAMAGHTTTPLRRVVCLDTAAYMNCLVTAAPAVVWIAVQNGTSVFRRGDAEQPLPVRVVQWSRPDMFKDGVIQKEMYGRAVNLTGPARTVVDLFQRAATRHHDIDIAKEALRTALSTGATDEDTIMDMATRLGVADAVWPGLREARPAVGPTR